MSSDIQEKLDQLSDLQAQRDLLEMQKKELIRQVLGPDLLAQLEEIEDEFASSVEGVDLNIAQLEREIRQEVIDHGATVKGEYLRAVYNRGRITWDSEKLEHMAQFVPEILGYRREGKPYISIVKI